jgi:hypothetical protein
MNITFGFPLTKNNKIRVKIQYSTKFQITCFKKILNGCYFNKSEHASKLEHDHSKYSIKFQITCFKKRLNGCYFNKRNKKIRQTRPPLMLYKEYIDHEVHTNMDIYPIWITYLEINSQKDWKLMVKKLNGSFFSK